MLPAALGLVPNVPTNAPTSPGSAAGKVAKGNGRPSPAGQLAAFVAALSGALTNPVPAGKEEQEKKPPQDTGTDRPAKATAPVVEPSLATLSTTGRASPGQLALAIEQLPVPPQLTNAGGKPVAPTGPEPPGVVPAATASVAPTDRPDMPTVLGTANAAVAPAVPTVATGNGVAAALALPSIPVRDKGTPAPDADAPAAPAIALPFSPPPALSSGVFAVAPAPSGTPSAAPTPHLPAGLSAVSLLAPVNAGAAGAEMSDGAGYAKDASHKPTVPDLPPSDAPLRLPESTLLTDMKGKAAPANPGRPAPADGPANADGISPPVTATPVTSAGGGAGQAAGASVADQVGRAVATHAETLGQDGQTQLRLQLDPPGLGSVRVQLTASGGQVNARLVVQVADTQHLLLGQAHVLRDHLAQAGITLGRFEVKYDGGSQKNGQQPAPEAPDPTTPRPAGRPAAVLSAGGPAPKGLIDVVA
jgi:flagellar hook-length control protein FliK